MNFLDELLRAFSGQQAGQMNEGGGLPTPQAPPQAAGGLPQVEEPQMEAPVDGEEVAVTGHRGYDHKGMFGVKGKTRNLLGLLGDAFLVQGGSDPHYRNVREREKKADALRGYNDNPLKALQRYMREDPDEGLEQMNDYTKAEAAETRAGVADRKERFTYEDKTLASAARLMASANDKNREHVREVTRRFLAARGVESPVDLDELPSYGYAVDKRVDDEAMYDHRQTTYDLRREKMRDDRYYRGERLDDFDADRGDRRTRGDAAPLVTTKNTKGQTVVVTRDRKVHVVPGSVDPRGTGGNKGRTAPVVGAPAGQPKQREGGRYRDTTNNRIYVVKNGKRVYE
jgi:hypothetical protein